MRERNSTSKAASTIALSKASQSRPRAEAVRAVEVKPGIVPGVIAVEYEQRDQAESQHGQRWQQRQSGVAARGDAAAPQQDGGKGKQMEIDSHIPDAGRQGFFMQQILKQNDICRQLRQRRESRHFEMRQGADDHRGADDGGRQRKPIWHGQAQKALFDRLQRLIQTHHAIGRQFAGQQKACRDKEYLHRETAVLIHPVDQIRHQGARDIGHRAVKGQMMRNDEQTGDRLQPIDARDAGIHLNSSIFK